MLPDFTAAISINWELANNDASKWALDYAYELVSGIVGRDRDRLAQEIDRFIQNGETINQLRDRLAPMFGADRANLIAVTEVTRAFAAGNQAAWETSKVVEGKQWNTAVDELVCPICGPLNGKTAALNETFGGLYDHPPAHPRCRCWLSPVVIKPEEI